MRGRIAIVVFVLGLTPLWSALAEDFPGAKIINVGQGVIVFEHDGKTKRLPVALALKIVDDKGEAQDPVTGVRFLAERNIVDIKTAPEKKTTKIVEVRFVSGKVVELPKTAATSVELRPHASFSGNPGEVYPSNEHYKNYLATAKVGDFVEYYVGKNKEPGRKETLEVAKDYIIVAQVSYLLGNRRESRFKVLRPKGATGQAARKKSKKPQASESEELEVAGQKLLCTIRSVDGKPQEWACTEVPFDGIVKVDSRNYQYILTSFGRGGSP